MFIEIIRCSDSLINYQLHQLLLSFVEKPIFDFLDVATNSTSLSYPPAITAPAQTLVCWYAGETVVLNHSLHTPLMRWHGILRQKSTLTGIEGFCWRKKKICSIRYSIQFGLSNSRCRDNIRIRLFLHRGASQFLLHTECTCFPRYDHYIIFLCQGKHLFVCFFC